MKSKNKGNTAKTTLAAELPQSNNSLKKFYYIFGLIAFFLFVNTLGNDYNMDDSMVTKNHKLTSQGLSAIGEIFTSPYYSDDAGYAYGYRPMVHLSFALEHEIFGEKPQSGHFINVILFALSVVLLFKFLIRLLGEEHLVPVCIATLLFTVHPIHTEVVNSLKNRDEILAFLFIIWSGIAMLKYLSKGKWIFIIGIFILFSIGMLSKKSVFPLAIILPSALILMKEISIKQLTILSLAAILPAAIIGSEMNLQRMILMLLTPMIVIICTFLLKKFALNTATPLIENSKDRNWIFVSLIAIAIVVVSTIIFQKLLIAIICIPFIAILIQRRLPLAIIAITIVFSCLSLIFKYDDLNYLPLILLISFAFLLLRKENKNAKWWFILAGTYFLYTCFNLNPIEAILNLIYITIFVFLLMKKPLIGFIITIIVSIGMIFFNTQIILPVLTFFLAVVLYIYELSKNAFWLKLYPIFALGLILIFNGIKNQRLEPTNTFFTKQINHETIAQLPENKSSFLKEGRQLEYVENTLVAPHTTAQFVATGFATLYEYARLHIFPKELSFYYGFSKTKTEDFKAPIVWISIIFHLTLIILALLQIKKRPIITIGVAWYLLCILLFSNWVELVAGMVGERLAFTASAGFCMLIAGIVMWIKPDLKLSNPGVVGYILIGCMVLFAGRTFVRNKDWKDNLTLMGHDIQHLQNSAQANNLYAMALMTSSVQNPNLTQIERADYQKRGVEHFEKAIEIWPDFYNAHIDIARATTLTKEYKKGIDYLHKAIKIDSTNVLTYYTLLELTEYSGDYPGYLETAQEVFKMIQNDHAYGYVARGYFLTKQFEKSKETLLEGLKVYPESDLLKNNLGFLKQQGYIN